MRLLAVAVRAFAWMSAAEAEGAPRIGGRHSQGRKAAELDASIVKLSIAASIEVAMYERNQVSEVLVGPPVEPCALAGRYHPDPDQAALRPLRYHESYGHQADFGMAIKPLSLQGLGGAQVQTVTALSHCSDCGSAYGRRETDLLGNWGKR
jgi:hypothetical protein